MGNCFAFLRLVSLFISSYSRDSLLERAKREKKLLCREVSVHGH